MGINMQPPKTTSEDVIFKGHCIHHDWVRGIVKHHCDWIIKHERFAEKNIEGMDTWKIEIEKRLRIMEKDLLAKFIGILVALVMNLVGVAASLIVLLVKN